MRNYILATVVFLIGVLYGATLPLYAAFPPVIAVFLIWFLGIDEWLFEKIISEHD